MIWIQITEYPNYAVSEDGEVKNISRGRLLTPRIDRDGYVIYTLYNKGKPKKLKAHRLVAQYHLDLPDNWENLPVNHKGGDKQNNHKSNVEWSTILENNRHARINGLTTDALTVEQVWEIRSLLIQGRSNTEIAKIYKVDQSTISNIKTGRTWNYV
ncbi:hypothetical protein bastian_151 [Salmonella phage bastian]|uniref:NUMOD4 domain-containing protein n=2 Tax=Epseptimavirus TaxID=2732017 RepID=A0A6G8RFB6_9CAUD|nr:hypothetical protein HWD26_gp115 [Salmonella phage bastian]QIO00088.1 hypothetical protein ende_148 [Salmonella phage ende]QIO00911.1 hypothetical protein bastian_151 [Salmonella phage bastian]